MTYLRIVSLLLFFSIKLFVSPMSLMWTYVLVYRHCSSVRFFIRMKRYSTALAYDTERLSAWFSFIEISIHTDFIALCKKRCEHDSYAGKMSFAIDLNAMNTNGKTSFKNLKLIQIDYVKMKKRHAKYTFARCINKSVVEFFFISFKRDFFGGFICKTHNLAHSTQ